MPIYRQVYKEAEPSADFDELLKTEEVSKENWFMKYYLPQERQEEKFNEFCEKKKCSQCEKKKISFEVWLGSLPSGVKKQNELKEKVVIK